MQPIARPDLTRIFLVILIIALLIAGSLVDAVPVSGSADLGHYHRHRDMAVAA